MTKTLTLSHKNWNNLRNKIIEDYGQATVLISWRLRTTLGFTVREHRGYQPGAEGHEQSIICLDFWDDQLQTMFLLRYSDYVSS
jgi:hypothetical protein